MRISLTGARVEQTEVILRTDRLLELVGRSIAEVWDAFADGEDAVIETRLLDRGRTAGPPA